MYIFFQLYKLNFFFKKNYGYNIKDYLNNTFTVDRVMIRLKCK